jgi:hypothetical protein
MEIKKWKLKQKIWTMQLCKWIRIKILKYCQEMRSRDQKKIRWNQNLNMVRYSKLFRFEKVKNKWNEGIKN